MAAVFDTPIHTGAANLDRVLTAGRPTLLVFETPACEPCRTLEPGLKELARTFAGRALVVQVDDAEEGNLATRFNLTRVPTLVYWQNGREFARIEGDAGTTVIRGYLESMLRSGAPPTPASGPSVPLHGTPAATPPPAGRPGAAPNGGPVAVTDASFQTEVLQSSLPVLVDFWAPWCGPCRMVSPIVEELGREYAGRLRVAKMNTDENPGRAGQLGIMGIPTLIFFKNGREVDRVVGAVPKQALQSRVERVLSSG